MKSKMLLCIVAPSISLSLVVTTFSCSCNHYIDVVKLNTQINKNIDASLINWQNKTSLEIYNEFANKNNQLKMNILKYRNIFFIGGIDLINDINSFEARIEFETVKKRQINIYIKILANHWYLDNKIRDKNTEDTLVEIVGLKNMPKTLDDKGGLFDNNQLKTDKYLEVVKTLHLQSTDILSTLDDLSISEKLHKFKEFQKLNLKIIDGSNTKKGILKLEFSGLYNKQTIEKTSITITGFRTILNSIKINLQVISINLNNWFENLQPIMNSNDIDNVLMISSDDWNEKYLSNFLLYDITNEKILSTKKDLKSSKIKLVLEPNFSKNKSEILFSIKNASFQNTKYENNQWISDGDLVEFVNVFQDNGSVSIPTEDDALIYVLNKTQINESELKKHYPSFWKGMENYFLKFSTVFWKDSNLIKNTEIDRIQNQYFRNKTIDISFEPNSIKANDFANSFEFKIVATINGVVKTNIYNFFSFLNKNKDINVLEYISPSSKNFVNFKTKSEVYNYVLNSIKDSFMDKMKEIILGPNVKNVVLGDLNSEFLVQVLGRKFSLNESIDIVKEKFNEIVKNIDFFVFNKKLNLDFSLSKDIKTNETLNYGSNLYWIDSSNSFVINSIQYRFLPNIEIICSKKDNVIMINFKGITDVMFEQNETLNYETLFSISFNKSDFKV